MQCLAQALPWTFVLPLEGHPGGGDIQAMSYYHPLWQRTEPERGCAIPSLSEEGMFFRVTCSPPRDSRGGAGMGFALPWKAGLRTQQRQRQRQALASQGEDLRRRCPSGYPGRVGILQKPYPEDVGHTALSPVSPYFHGGKLQ
jgi:hypothetical protein